MCGLQESFEHNFSPNLESQKTSQSENFRFRSVLREQHFPWLVCQRRAIAAGSPPFLPEWFGSHSYQASNANKPSREEAAGTKPTSFALKSMVRADPTGINTVMRAFPAR